MRQRSGQGEKKQQGKAGASAADPSRLGRALARLSGAGPHERLLRDAMDALDEGFVLYDAQDRLVFCNARFREVYADVDDLLQPGVPFEELLRAHVARAPAHHEARGQEEAWIARRLAQHRHGDTRSELHMPDGRWLRLLECKLPDGHIAGFRIDITDLVTATQAAEKAARAKSQFLANMSHEIRTPMNAVLGMLRLLQKTTLSARQRDYLGKAEGAARSLLGLLGDILDFSKVESGKMGLDLQPLRVDELLRELSVILAASLGQRPIELLFDVDPGLPPVVIADALRLQQVLVNLAGNAIKFTEAGEVVVRLRLVAMETSAVTLDFEVSDTGIGIAPEHQQQIFEGFSQAEASTTRRYGGTGLGLSISRFLVQLMGGGLQVESELGRGSRFFFRLRLALPPTVPAQRETLAGTAARALLVDDNAAARALMGGMVAAMGWHVDLAESGDAALRRMRETLAAGACHELVLVDWAMPGMDGWETSRALRALAREQGCTPPLFMMVTAEGRELLAQRCEQEEGASELFQGFLIKPVTPSMVYDAVTDARAAARALSGAPPEAPRLHRPLQSRLAGLRLLVVEDNANNRQIARELLEAEGAFVLLAGDGQQALSQLAQSKQGRRIDAVLMDVQMPVMDGFTATRLIRRQLGLTLPVIAMTANAAAEDRQACLDVGMSEHVGKPFDIDHLAAVLMRHCGAAAALAQGQPPLFAPAQTVSALPPALLARARGMGIELGEALGRLSGKSALFASTSAALAEAAWDLPQPPTVAALHSLRGLAATLGARALAQLAAEGEHALQAGHEPGPVWQQRFAQRLAHDLAALQELVPQLPTGLPAHTPLPEALAPGLSGLIELLDGSDMDALDAFARLRPALAGERAPVAAQLDEALARLDFPGAAGHCRALLRELRA